MKDAPPLNKINTTFKNNFQHKTTATSPWSVQYSTLKLGCGIPVGLWTGYFYYGELTIKKATPLPHNKTKTKKKRAVGSPRTVWIPLHDQEAMRHLKLFLSVPLYAAKDGSLIIVTVFTIIQSHRCTDLHQVQQKAAPVDEGRPLCPASVSWNMTLLKVGCCPTHT